MVYGPESELSDILAMHTIEMIPKSMILAIVYFYILIKQSFLHKYGCNSMNIKIPTDAGMHLYHKRFFCSMLVCLTVMS